MVDTLISQNRLRRLALLIGSEAARGVPKLRMKRPMFATHSPESWPRSSTARFSRTGKLTP
jgi:hypothetical protein